MPVVRQERGDHESALTHYRGALAIDEQLGDRTAIATSLSRIGALLTIAGQPADGLEWTVRSLTFAVGIGSQEASIDLHWLGRQRRELGDGPFQSLLRQHVDEPTAQDITRVLDQRSRLPAPAPDGEIVSKESSASSVRRGRS